MSSGSILLPIAGTGGTVTSVTASAPLASSGGNTPNLSLTGIVGVPEGGTGAGTLTLHNVLLGNGTNTVQFVAPGSSGNVLTSDGTTWNSSAPAASGIPTIGTSTDTAIATWNGTAGSALNNTNLLFSSNTLSLPNTSSSPNSLTIAAGNNSGGAGGSVYIVGGTGSTAATVGQLVTPPGYFPNNGTLDGYGVGIRMSPDGAALGTDGFLWSYDMPSNSSGITVVLGGHSCLTAVNRSGSFSISLGAASIYPDTIGGSNTRTLGLATSYFGLTYCGKYYFGGPTSDFLQDNMVLTSPLWNTSAWGYGIDATVAGGNRAYTGLYDNTFNHYRVPFTVLIDNQIANWYPTDSTSSANADHLLLRAGNASSTGNAGDLILSGGVSSGAGTSGNTFMPNTSGAPSVTPNAHTGYSAFTFDPSTNILYIYNGSTWKSVTLS